MNSRDRVFFGVQGLLKRFLITKPYHDEQKGNNGMSIVVTFDLVALNLQVCYK